MVDGSDLPWDDVDLEVLGGELQHQAQGVPLTVVGNVLLVR